MFKKNADLAVLGISVPLAWNQKYHDDGFVTDLAEYAIQKRMRVYPMDQKIRKAWTEKYRKDYRGHSGITVTVSKTSFFLFDQADLSIAYLESGNEAANTFFRGRQETDALLKLGGQKTLEDLLKKNYLIRAIQPKQKRILDIGGVYGLLRLGYKPREILSQSRFMDDRTSWKLRTALLDLTQASSRYARA